MRLELYIAWRYLTAKRRERFISLITLISVMGVAVGVAALIISQAIMAGFDADLKDKIIGANPHIMLTGPGMIAEDAAGPQRISSFEGVKGASGFISGQIVLKAQDSTVGALIKGIDPQREGTVTRIADYIEKGGLPQENGQITLGSELAYALGRGIGDEITIISPVDGKKYPFRVAGLFRSGMYDYDANLAFVTIRGAQNIFSKAGMLDGIGIGLDNAYAARDITELIQEEFGGRWTARTWMDMNKNFFSALKLEKTVMFIVLALIVLVACFNIASTLIMIVMEKTRDIGILKAIGMPNASIRTVFTLEGLIVGLLGTAIGLAGGIGLSYALERYQFIKLPPDIYYLDKFPIQIQWFDTAVISAAAVLLSLLATLYPAWQASRLNPIDALRYE